MLIKDTTITRVPSPTITKWISSQFIVPIEDIASDLIDAYTYEDAMEVESEFVGYCIREHDPLVIIPGEFLNKVAAAVAIMKNPYEFLQDKVGFINVCAVCNDIAAPEDETFIFEPQYLVRTFDAVNSILPEEMELMEVHFGESVSMYILECYLAKGRIVMDDEFSFLQDDRFNYLDGEKMRESAKKLVSVLKQLYAKMLKGIDDSDEQLRTALSTAEKDEVGIVMDMMINAFLADLEKLDAYTQNEIASLITGYLYKKYYGLVLDLTHKEKSKLILPKDKKLIGV